jgi:hypothetical protein
MKGLPPLEERKRELDRWAVRYFLLLLFGVCGLCALFIGAIIDKFGLGVIGCAAMFIMAWIISRPRDPEE